MKRILALAFTAGFVLHLTSWLPAQGPLTPPGAPAPTMKTLDQVEPRKEVNATNTPGDASNVFVISQSGSYYLSGNISGAGTRNAISIQASDVTLDLNGFSITAVTTVRGIIVVGAQRNLHVHHGTVRSALVGIDAAAVVNSIFEHLRISNCAGDGLLTGAGALVESCTALDNTADGLQVGTRSVVRNCVASGNDGSAGIFTGSSCTVSGCNSSNNDGASGIAVGPYSVVVACVADSNASSGITNNGSAEATIKDCSASNNAVTGILAGNSCTVSGCTAAGNVTGIIAGSNSSVSHCQAHANTGHGIYGNGSFLNCSATSNELDGIRATSGNSTVANCTSTNNTGNGIRLEGRCLAIGNTCASNGSGTGDAAGILASGGDNRIEGNNVATNDRGIEVTGAGNLIIRNSASGNTTNYEIVADNRYGVILDLTAAGSAAVSGDSATGTLTTTTNPWANFSY